MAKVKTMGQAIVVVSEVKLEDIKKIQKYRPEALVLKGGEDNKEEIPLESESVTARSIHTELPSARKPVMMRSWRPLP